MFLPLFPGADSHFNNHRPGESVVGQLSWLWVLPSAASLHSQTTPSVWIVPKSSHHKRCHSQCCPSAIRPHRQAAARSPHRGPEFTDGFLAAFRNDPARKHIPLAAFPLVLPRRNLTSIGQCGNLNVTLREPPHISLCPVKLVYKKVPDSRLRTSLCPPDVHFPEILTLHQPQPTHHHRNHGPPLQPPYPPRLPNPHLHPPPRNNPLDTSRLRPQDIPDDRGIRTADKIVGGESGGL